MRDRRLLPAALAALLAAYALPAAAQDAASAQDLRDKARAALASGDTAGACVLFEQSYQAAKAAGSAVTPDEALFDLADCHDKLGKKATASAEFEQLAAGTGPKAEDAKKRAAALKSAAPEQAPPPGSPPSPPPPPVAVGTLTGGEPPTRIGDFMDTRLSWTFGDDDILHATGQAFPLSPNFSIGDRPQYRLFFDNLNSRFGGRENLTHLALYKKMPSFIKKLDTEASLVLRFDIAALASNTNNLNQALYDAGSYIRAFYHTGDDPNGKTGLGITFWPIDTDRFRLGYLYDLSWGGTAAYINQSIFPRIQGAAPGAKLQYDGDGWSIFAGFKTASIVQVETTLAPGTSEVEQIRVAQTNVGALAGGSVDITDFLRLDVNGGFFQQGKFDLPDVAGKPVWTGGFSGRVVVHDKDMPVPMSIDFLLYRNDPNKPQVIFKPEEYTPGKTTWLVSGEYDHLFQNLKDFDVAGATKVQQAHAAALQAQLKSSFFRASLTGIFRDLPYVLRNQPSMIPFETIPKDATTKPELFFAAAADYYFDGPHLTPGIGAGLQFPATFQSTSTNSASTPIDRTVVVRQQGNLGILPVNKGAVPIVQARFSLRWDVSRILSAVIWAQYVRDNNLTFVERDPSEGTVALRAFIKPDFFGLGTSVQARF
jgi:tetratricopeptide (TPR) repeat protein